MGRHSRVSDAQRVELWRRYRAGETVLCIAQALVSDQPATYTVRWKPPAG